MEAKKENKCEKFEIKINKKSIIKELECRYFGFYSGIEAETFKHKLTEDLTNEIYNCIICNIGIKTEFLFPNIFLVENLQKILIWFKNITNVSYSDLQNIYDELINYTGLNYLYFPDFDVKIIYGISKKYAEGIVNFLLEDYKKQEVI